MTFPNAHRLGRGRPAATDQQQPAEVVGPQGGSEPDAGGLQPEATNASDGGAATESQANGAQAPAALRSDELDRLSVQAALRGDQQAFADLVARYQSAVYNMAYRMLGDATEAEDAAQEVFVRAWNQLHTFQLDRRFSTWLLSIASHYAIDVLRRRRPAAPLDDVALYVESDEPEPDEIALQGEQADTVKRLLSKLPEKYRSVTVLRYYNDLSYEEIARVTGLTESAVKTQLHRARRMLAEQILGKGGTPHGVPDDLR
jgi:RNA polymerase sigma-70 factor (ECF subfamily)